MDRYAQKTPKTLVVVHDLDRYEHCTHLPPTGLWLERAYRWKKEWKEQKEGWTGRHWRQASQRQSSKRIVGGRIVDRGAGVPPRRYSAAGPSGPRMDVAGVEAPGRGVQGGLGDADAGEDVVDVL